LKQKYGSVIPKGLKIGHILLNIHQLYLSVN